MSEDPVLTGTEMVQYRAEGLRLRAEAAADLRAAKEERAAADYALGQAEHRLKTIQATEAGFSAREKWLKENKEDELRKLAADAAADRKRTEELMASYDAAKHGAAQALINIDARERAERGEAA